MALKLNTKLRDLVSNGGLNPAYYSVTFLNLPKEAEALQGERILCKGAALPGVKTNTVDFFHDGVKYPIKRELQYDQTMDLTFYADKADKEHIEFLKWAGSGGLGDSTYNASMLISIGEVNTSKESNFVPDATFSYFSIFPTTVSDIKLGYDKTNEVSEFTVTFAYSKFGIREGR